MVMQRHAIPCRDPKDRLKVPSCAVIWEDNCPVVKLTPCFKGSRHKRWIHICMSLFKIRCSRVKTNSSLLIGLSLALSSNDRLLVFKVLPQSSLDELAGVIFGLIFTQIDRHCCSLIYKLKRFLTSRNLCKIHFHRFLHSCIIYMLEVLPISSIDWHVKGGDR